MKYLLFIVFAVQLSCRYQPENQETASFKLPQLPQKYNNEVLFYIDLEKHSGEARFQIIDIATSEILKEGLCCNGKTDTVGKVIYSNVPQSYCSSKGLYKIGKTYVGDFGKAYRLHGLDSSNSKAFERDIVLHSHACVPVAPVDYAICESQGCPTVNPEFFKVLEQYIDESNKPVLLYIQ